MRERAARSATRQPTSRNSSRRHEEDEAHESSFASERLSEADEPGREPFARLPVDLEAQIEPDGTDRRFVPDAAADGASQFAEVHIADAREHVAGIEEPD